MQRVKNLGLLLIVIPAGLLYVAIELYEEVRDSLFGAPLSKKEFDSDEPFEIPVAK